MFTMPAGYDAWKTTPPEDIEALLELESLVDEHSQILDRLSALRGRNGSCLMDADGEVRDRPLGFECVFELRFWTSEEMATDLCRSLLLAAAATGGLDTETVRCELSGVTYEINVRRIAGRPPAKQPQ